MRTALRRSAQIDRRIIDMIDVKEPSGEPTRYNTPRWYLPRSEIRIRYMIFLFEDLRKYLFLQWTLADGVCQDLARRDRGERKKTDRSQGHLRKRDRISVKKAKLFGGGKNPSPLLLFWRKKAKIFDVFSQNKLTPCGAYGIISTRKCGVLSIFKSYEKRSY